MKKGIQLLLLVLCLFSVTFVSAKKYTCETVDGAYYGKDGKEVDKVQYEKECSTHQCEIVGDTYYGADGKSVSRDTFEKECDASVVSELPDTGSHFSPTEIFFMIIGSIFLLGGTIFTVTSRLLQN